MTPNKKDVEFGGYTPEGTKIWNPVKRKKIPKNGPPPPPNFLPGELSKTYPQDSPPILTQAQAIFEAMEEKEK